MVSTTPTPTPTHDHNHQRSYDSLALLQLLDRVVNVTLDTVARVEGVVDREHCCCGARELVLEAVNVALELRDVGFQVHNFFNRVDKFVVVCAAHVTDLELFAARVCLETRYQFKPQEGVGDAIM